MHLRGLFFLFPSFTVLCFIRRRHTARIINCDHLNPIASFPLSSPRSRWQPASLPSLSPLYIYIYIIFFFFPLSTLSSSIFCPHWTACLFVCLPVCPSLPRQDTQSTSALPDDSGSVLMDDTSSQWSAAADSEEERKSALEKSMYVFFLQYTSCMCLHYSWIAVTWMYCHLSAFIRHL